MLIRFGYEIAVRCEAPTPMVCLMDIRPERRRDMVSPEKVVTTPEVPKRTYLDMFGNVCRRFTALPGDFSIWADGVVADSGLLDPVHSKAQEVPVQDLPDACLSFLLGSRYCETDALSQAAWDLFGHEAPGWNRVQAICDYVHGHLAFGYENARATRTAKEAYEEGVGVCRDYAHLAITFCRCMNIPARYVNGYLGDIGVPILDPMDFSAWMEVYLDGEWMTFDPRNNVPRIGRLQVARGRDAADVPLINSFGPHTLKSFRVWTYDVTGLR
ncbi:transglutaminase family protein [Pelagibacterium halotolerans]|uniref:transglutaminase-like domain-containing protein n=1 Tax=Pelagibacterium halotolerans TaxID=531813 RepID=UPI00384BAB91